MLSTHAPLDHTAEDDAFFAAWRARELTRLVDAGIVYADFTGSALYPESLVRDDAIRLCGTLLGNPHSAHAPSRRATDDLEAARTAILDFLDASHEEYAVVFTANASAACRLVGESFPFERGSTLLLSQDNHNSVNGLREFARRRRASLRTIDLDEQLALVAPHEALASAPRAPSLFAFPAQSNFSGVRHPLSLVEAARRAGYLTLLDAASSLHTQPLSLRVVPADFVVLSLYKLIGYPAGVGALVARRDALARLERPWFAGGTVQWVSVARASHRLASGAEGFEDGTPPFALAGAIPAALTALRAVGAASLARHSRALTAALLRGIDACDTRRGRVVVHGPRDVEGRGATIAFNLLDRLGRVRPYWHVEEAAKRSAIALRGGCFCNPGAAERAFAIDAPDAGECLRALGADFTVPRFAACLASARGRASPVGALRVSFGAGSTMDDVRRILDFVRAEIDSETERERRAHEGVSTGGGAAQLV